MTNPNNCAACKHKDYPDGGWCYMFRLAPTEPCAQHTEMIERTKASRMQVAAKLLERFTK